MNPSHSPGHLLFAHTLGFWDAHPVMKMGEPLVRMPSLGQRTSSGSSALSELFRNAGRFRGPGTVRRPIAALLTCVDERIVPEVIFGTKPGTLYTVRLAGNIVTPEVISSLEIAVGLGCPLVVVLGHTDCSAVRLEREHSTDHFPILGPIRWATQSLSLNAGLSEALEANVRFSVDALRSRIRVPTHGAMYDVVTGEVTLVS